jgi:hypothetical protein
LRQVGLAHVLQKIGVDRIFSECGFVTAKTEAPQPTLDRIVASPPIPGMTFRA